MIGKKANAAATTVAAASVATATTVAAASVATATAVATAAAANSNNSNAYNQSKTRSFKLKKISQERIKLRLKVEQK